MSEPGNGPSAWEIGAQPTGLITEERLFIIRKFYENNQSNVTDVRQASFRVRKKEDT